MFSRSVLQDSQATFSDQGPDVRRKKQPSSCFVTVNTFLLPHLRVLRHHSYIVACCVLQPHRGALCGTTFRRQSLHSTCLTGTLHCAIHLRACCHSTRCAGSSYPYDRAMKRPAWNVHGCNCRYRKKRYSYHSPCSCRGEGRPNT